MNDIDWETNKLEFKFDAESMEEEILNISLRLKEPLSSLKQLVEVKYIYNNKFNNNLYIFLF